MKRSSTAAGFSASTMKIPCCRVSSSTPSLQRGCFRFFDFPAEIRNMIYRKVFTPSASDIDPTKQNTTLRLTYTSRQGPAIRILKRRGGRINILRPTYFASFALASSRIYNEVVPIMGRHTTLHLSGADYDYFCANIHPSSFVGGLLKEVAKYTSHIAIEGPILARSTSLQNQLVAQDIFPCLHRVTVYSCGPAEVTYNGLPFALSADDAEKLLAQKTWPNATLQRSVGSILDRYESLYIISTPSGSEFYPDLLGRLRSRFNKAQANGSGGESKPKKIEVVFKLPLVSTIMSATKTNSVCFDISEITVDFDTNKITDVSFQKLEKVPKRYRNISTAMAFLDRPVSGPVRRRPRAEQDNHAVSFQPQP